MLPTPSAFQPSRASTLRPWIASSPSKWYSTFQEQRQWQNDGGEAAILHGGKNGQKPKGRQARDNPNSELPKASRSGRSERMTPSRSKEQKHAHGGRRDVLRHEGSKRKAESHEDPRSARRQRGPDLKDEAWLRRTMHVPTIADYPDLREGFFKEPKSSLINATQGLATLESKFVTLHDGIFQCTLRYESVTRTEIVEAEGRSKVG